MIGDETITELSISKVVYNQKLIISPKNKGTVSTIEKCKEISNSLLNTTSSSSSRQFDYDSSSPYSFEINHKCIEEIQELKSLISKKNEIFNQKLKLMKDNDSLVIFRIHNEILSLISKLKVLENTRSNIMNKIQYES